MTPLPRSPISILRMFRIVKRVRSLQDTLASVGAALGATFGELMLLLLAMFLLAMAGMNLFGDVEIPDSYNTSYVRYDTFGLAFLQVMLHFVIF